MINSERIKRIERLLYAVWPKTFGECGKVEIITCCVSPENQDGFDTKQFLLSRNGKTHVANRYLSGFQRFFANHLPDARFYSVEAIQYQDRPLHSSCAPSGDCFELG